MASQNGARPASDLESEARIVESGQDDHRSSRKPDHVQASCEQCGERFTPRGSGKAQKFCSADCRRAFHDDRSQRAQRARTCNASNGQSRDLIPVEPKKRARSPQNAETIDNPPAEIGTYIDHRAHGGPLLHVPEHDLRRVDALAEPDFDCLADESVVLHEQQSIAIYRNRRGDLVIRQERAWDENEDIVIVIAATNVKTFVDRILDEAGVPARRG